MRVDMQLPRNILQLLARFLATTNYSFAGGSGDTDGI